MSFVANFNSIFFLSQGVVSFGILPISFELVLENTHPLDPSAGLSLIFALSQLTAIIFISLVRYFKIKSLFVLSDLPYLMKVEINQPFLYNPLSS